MEIINLFYLIMSFNLQYIQYSAKLGMEGRDTIFRDTYVISEMHS